jgi:hypothetical protein
MSTDSSARLPAGAFACPATCSAEEGGCCTLGEKDTAGATSGGRIERVGAGAGAGAGVGAGAGGTPSGICVGGLSASLPRCPISRVKASIAWPNSASVLIALGEKSSAVRVHKTFVLRCQPLRPCKHGREVVQKPNSARTVHPSTKQQSQPTRRAISLAHHQRDHVELDRMAVLSYIGVVQCVQITAASERERERERESQRHRIECGCSLSPLNTTLVGGVRVRA